MMKRRRSLQSLTALALVVGAPGFATSLARAADGPYPSVRSRVVAEPPAGPSQAPVDGPAYRFQSGYSGPAVISTPSWGYLFGGGYSQSPAYNYYAPGYVAGPATSAAPTGRYYASPCYYEPQQVWDGYRWRLMRIKVCR